MDEKNFKLLVDYALGLKIKKNENHDLNKMAYISHEILRLDVKTLMKIFLKECKIEEDTRDNSQTDLNDIELPQEN